MWCVECGRPAEMGLTSADGRSRLYYCIPCAKGLAKDYNLPAVASAVADAERLKREANRD